MSFAQDYADYYAKFGKTGEGGAPTGATTTTITESTTTGSTTEGVLSYAIENTGGGNGTIDSVTFAPGEGVAVDGGGLPLDSVSFVATGTTFRILQVALA